MPSWSDLHREASCTHIRRDTLRLKSHVRFTSVAYHWPWRVKFVPVKMKTTMLRRASEYRLNRRNRMRILNYPTRYRNSVPFNRARNFTRNDCQRPRSQRRTCATSAETKAPVVRRCNIWLQLPLFDYTTVRGVNFPRQLKWLLPSWNRSYNANTSLAGRPTRTTANRSAALIESLILATKIRSPARLLPDAIGIEPSRIM